MFLTAFSLFAPFVLLSALGVSVVSVVHTAYALLEWHAVLSASAFLTVVPVTAHVELPRYTSAPVELTTLAAIVLLAAFALFAVEH